MKRITYILFLVLLLFSACSKKNKKIKLSGQIKNSRDYNILTINNGVNTDTITLNKEGAFKSVFKYATGYYFLQYANKSIPVFLQQGEKVTVTADANNFENSLQVTSKETAEINNYLVKKYNHNRKILDALGGYQSLFLYSEKRFIATMDSLKDSNLKLMKTFNLSNNFVAYERKNIRYNYLSVLVEYPEKYRRWQYRPDYEPTAIFQKRFQNLTFNNEEAYKMFPAYKMLVLNKFQQKYFKKLPNSKQVVVEIHQSKIEPFPNDFAYMLYFKMKHKATETIGMEKILLEDIGKLTKSKRVLSWLEEQKVLNILSLEGQLSPDFNFESIIGKNVKLSNLRGKVVYIDVWATWCGECRKEFSHLKKVEALYHNSDVAFVGLSLDKDKNKWREMVNQFQLKGIQVIADKAWMSDFVLAYQFGAIPRFILIDKQGYVVNADAPRPSNPNLIKLLDNLLKK